MRGGHTFRAHSREKGLQKHFGYQETGIEGEHVKGECAIPVKNGIFSAFASVSTLRFEALEPEILANQYTFITNNFIESYQGSLRNIFAGEKYLFTGEFFTSQISSGISFKRESKGWKLKADLMYTRLFIAARAELTKKTTTLIIFPVSETDRTGLPDTYLHCITPGVVVQKQLGNMYLKLSVRQAVPIYIKTLPDSEPGALSEEAPENRLGDGVWGGLELGTSVGLVW